MAAGSRGTVDFYLCVHSPRAKNKDAPENNMHNENLTLPSNYRISKRKGANQSLIKLKVT